MCVCGKCVGSCLREDSGFSGKGDGQLNGAFLQHAAACLRVWPGHA